MLRGTAYYCMGVALLPWMSHLAEVVGGHVTEAGKQRWWLSQRRVQSQQESKKGKDCTAGRLGIA